MILNARPQHSSVRLLSLLPSASSVWHEDRQEGKPGDTWSAPHTLGDNQHTVTSSCRLANIIAAVHTWQDATRTSWCGQSCTCAWLCLKTNMHHLQGTLQLTCMCLVPPQLCLASESKCLSGNTFLWKYFLTPKTLNFCWALQPRSQYDFRLLKTLWLACCPTVCLV